MQNISPTVRNIFSIPGIRLALFLATQLTLSLPDIHVYVKVGFCLFALASLIAEKKETLHWICKKQMWF
mgnify:CR=1 FL=1